MATDAATEADGAQGHGLCDPTLAAGNRRTERPKQAPAGARQPQARKDVKPACSRRRWHRFLHTVVPARLPQSLPGRADLDKRSFVKVI